MARLAVLLVVGATAFGPTPHNQLPGLVPPSGGWRGSTLGPASLVAAGPTAYQHVYGHRLHLWRCFKTPDTAAVTANEEAFVRAGGILWYNMQPTNWSLAATAPAFAATIGKYATAVKGLAPAKVLVNAGHEPDGHCDPAEHRGDSYFGTPAEYRAMWRRFQAVFAEAGVDNAVWVMDYSRGLSKPAAFQKYAAALWPGDGAVDWLFFNAFGDHPMADRRGRGNFTALVDRIYTQLEAAATAAAAAGPNYTAIPWGVGAFAPKPPPLMAQADRQRYIAQAAAALNSSRFPRLRGLVYYDHDASGMPPSFQAAYTRYLSSPFFTAND